MTTYEEGAAGYRAGRPYSDCLTDEARDGWIAEWNKGIGR